MASPVVKLVGDLYACLVTDEPATAALDVLCSALGAAHAIVMRTGPDFGEMFATSHHLASVSASQFDGLDRSDEYRQLVASVPAGSAFRITDIMPRHEIVRTAMYQATLRPLDGGLAVYGLQRDASDMVVTAVCRSAAADPDFEDDAVALLAAALPHLVTITAIAGRLAQDRLAGQRIRDALDMVADGVIVLDPDGRIRHVNAAADASLTRGDRIRRSRTGIVAANRADDLRLQRAIGAVRSFQGGFDDCERAAAATAPFQVMLGRGFPGWPLVANVMPGDRLSGASFGGGIVVQLRDPGTVACLSPSSLVSELGLTHREAQLVQELARGATLTRSAANMDISTGTARQYLKTIFLKACVDGQTELLRLVSR